MCQHNQLSWCSSASLALCLTKPSYINSLVSYLSLKPVQLIYLIPVIIVHEVAGNHHWLHRHLLSFYASLECWAVAHTSLADSAIHMEGSQVSFLEDCSLKHRDSTDCMLKGRRLRHIVPVSKLLIWVGLVDWTISRHERVTIRVCINFRKAFEESGL